MSDEEEELARLADEGEAEKAREQAKESEVYRRLLSRLSKGYIELPFTTPEGETRVKMRMPSDAQRNAMTLATAELIAGVKDEARAVAISETVSNLMVALCPEIPREAWVEGTLGVDVTAKLLRYAQGFERIRDEELQFFR